jgi:hypothetical protein
MESPLHKQIEAAEAFAQQHLNELCKEIISLDTTKYSAITRYRELVQLLVYIPESHRFTHARHIITSQAVLRIAEET